MNTFSRFEVETLARQRQSEIEKYLRETQRTFGEDTPAPTFINLKAKLTIGAVTLSIVSLIAIIIVITIY
jgi:hypothetical protein